MRSLTVAVLNRPIVLLEHVSYVYSIETPWSSAVTSRVQNFWCFEISGLTRLSISPFESRPLRSFRKVFMSKSKLAILTLVLVALTISTVACNTQPTHPNQINTFDGASYDSLTVAHAALASFRVRVSTVDKQYVSVFNEAATAYAAGFNAYSVYRATQSNEAAVTLTIANLTVSIVSLENEIQAALQVSPQTVLNVRRQARKIRAAASPRISISDILTELEIAASIAQTVPGAQSYAGLAAIVINAARQALAAQT